MCWSQFELCYPLGLCIEVKKKKMTAKYPVLIINLFVCRKRLFNRWNIMYFSLLTVGEKTCFYISPYKHCWVYPY